MLKIAICDDNSLDRDRIAKEIDRNLREMSVLYELDKYNNAEILIAKNEQKPYDIIFLDINMPLINGMDAALKINRLNHVPEIVFVSSYNELVFEACRCKSSGFVRKEYLSQELSERLLYLTSQILQNRKYITIQVNGVDKKLNIEDIIYMKSDDHYVDIFTVNGKESVRTSLNEMEEKYANFGFIRIHLRFLVNYRYIFSVEKNTIILNDGNKLALSRLKVNHVTDKLQKLMRGF